MRLHQSNKTLLFTSLSLFLPEFALAHAGNRGHVMLLPTQLYIAGGAAVVALTFVAMFFVTRNFFSDKLLPLKSPEVEVPSNLWLNWLSLLVLFFLIWTGFTGSHDPLMNLLPLSVWVIWWIGLTMATAVFGNIWVFISPLPAVQKWVSYIPGEGLRKKGERINSERWAYWPATLLFLGFAWFELIHPAPMDPETLARIILLYLLMTGIGMWILGGNRWLHTGDPFTVFFRMVGWLSPFYFKPSGEKVELRKVKIRWPCAGLLRGQPLPISGVAFVLLVLSTVSFDGLSKTFWWLSLVGKNPLEFSGRTEMIVPNTLGLCITYLLFLSVFFITQKISSWLAPKVKKNSSFVYSLIPIAFGYHFAHYLPTFLVDIQYAMIALSDPFGSDWNLIGTADWIVTSSYLTNFDSAVVIWFFQIFSIVLAHVGAVVVSHLHQLQGSDNIHKTMLEQVPATVLMIGYTVLGLWLLSTPVAI